MRTAIEEQQMSHPTTFRTAIRTTVRDEARRIGPGGMPTGAVAAVSASDDVNAAVDGAEQAAPRRQPHGR